MVRIFGPIRHQQHFRLFDDWKQMVGIDLLQVNLVGQVLHFLGRIKALIDQFLKLSHLIRL